jgi:hypothetical protein
MALKLNGWPRNKNDRVNDGIFNEKPSEIFSGQLYMPDLNLP